MMMQLRRGSARSERHASDVWTPTSDHAVRELLDHLAQELAAEYVRLMKKAASAETDLDMARGREKGR